MGRGELCELGCGSGLAGIDPDIGGDFFDDLGDAVSDVGDWVSANAPGLLSVVGGAVGTVVLPGVGTAIGSSLGGAVGKAVKGSPSSGGGVQVAPTPIVNDLKPYPGIDNLFPIGFGGSIRGNNGGPITIHEEGWTLDVGAAQWVKGARRLGAKAGDRNTVTGQSYPPQSLGNIIQQIARNPAVMAAAAKARGQQYQSINLAAPPAPSPAPAKPWTPVQKAAGVGAAVGLGYIAWRIVNM